MDKVTSEDQVSNESSEQDRELWRRLAESYISLAKSSREFLEEEVDRVALMRVALLRRDRPVALYLAPFLSVEDKQALLDEWTS